VPQNTLKIRHFYRHILNYILWQRQHQALAWNLSPFFAENGQKTEDPMPEDCWQRRAALKIRSPSAISCKIYYISSCLVLQAEFRGLILGLDLTL
jgi:hypothetical protein|tara:strand:- start:278 stop:562 length:285 start_codon:yes stop_codon:yes gene_type:complete